MLFECPICGRALVTERKNGRIKFSCFFCQYSHTVELKEGEDEVDAYLELEEILSEKREELVKRRIRRTREEIERLVEKEGLKLDQLPRFVKEILGTRKDFIVDYKYFERVEPEYGSRIEELGLHPSLVRALKSKGIERLYKFQEEAIKLVLEGENVVISAPTGSGKTEAFTIPVMQKILEDAFSPWPLRRKAKAIKALFIYPTKALNRDQYAKLEYLTKYTYLDVAVFDGDTPQRERQRIYTDPPDILITDLDTLDYHMRNRRRLSRLLKSVEFVVLDELHVYQGVLGASAHYILERLRRICGEFQAIGSSATLSNAKEFAEKLFNRPVVEVRNEAFRRSPLHFVMVYPSTRSFRSVIVGLLEVLKKYGLKTLVFANTHLDAELIGFHAKKRKLNVMVHRAGLPPSFRVEVEEKFKKGEIKAIVATPTLELGIDIGDLDVVISTLIPYPRMVQRLGRAGRRGQESLAILVLREDDPISLYYLHHPDKYFTDIPPAFVEPRNPIVAKMQVLSAVLDKPMEVDEKPLWKPVLRSLKQEGLVEVRGRRVEALPHAKKLFDSYSIRSIGEQVDIVYRGKVIGNRQLPIALWELFPGAVYLHGGKLYRSADFVYDPYSKKRYAKLVELPEDFPYYTRALKTSIPKVLEVVEEKAVGGVQAWYCKLRVTSIVPAYLLMEIGSNKVVKKVELKQPLAYSFETFGFVFKAPTPVKLVQEMLGKKDVQRKLEEEYAVKKGRLLLDVEDPEFMLLGGAFHAVEHVLIEGSDMLTGGGRSEMGGVSMGTTGLIYVYDGTPGGTGSSRLLFDRLAEGFKRSLSILTSCDCTTLSGCPRCTYSYRCGNNNFPLFKLGAAESLKLAVKGERTSIAEEDLKVEEGIV